MSFPKSVIACASVVVIMLLYALGPAAAGASVTRELLGSFSVLAEPDGMAVDLETGNVYVVDRAKQTVDVFGPEGGPPLDGVPSRITGLTIGGGDIPAGVAVDNSCYEHAPRLTGSECEAFDPSYGDVYVVQTEHYPYTISRYSLNSAGQYAITGVLPVNVIGLEGVTVDSQGNVYYVGIETGEPAYELKKEVEKATVGGKEELKETLREIPLPQHIVENSGYIAVDEQGNVYIGSENEFGGPGEGYNGLAKLNTGASGVVSEEVCAGNIVGIRRPVAVDRARGLVYVGDGDEIAEYDSSGDLQLKFGSSEAQGGSLGEGSRVITASAIAVDSGRERIYVANPRLQDVDVFGSVIGPPVIAVQQPAAVSKGRTSVLVKGSVDPDSGQPGTFFFEYVDSNEYQPTSTDPYQAGGRTGSATLTGGHSQALTPGVGITGLIPGTQYDYRLVVNNPGGTSYGPDETFTTAPPTPPVATTGSASDVTATSATLAGVVAPRGLSTSYVFEVGTDTGYLGARLFGNAGTGTGEVPVSTSLQFLVPGMTYHYRLVARSFDGASYGQDQTFTTPALSSQIEQPESNRLLPSPTAQFPSIAGAITVSQNTVRARKVERRKRSKKSRARSKSHKKPHGHKPRRH